MKKLVVWAVAGLLFAGGGPVLASGYSIYEQGAKASGQASAFAARADDPSAIFYNPAAITELNGWQVMVGSTAIFLGDSTFKSPSLGDDEMIHNTVFPSHLYLTQRASDRISWGVGLYTPFGLETEWDDSSPLRFSSRHAEVVTVFLNPVIAFRLSDAFSIAVGFSYVSGEVRAFSRNVDLTELAAPPLPGPLTTPSTAGQELFTNLRGDDDDFAFNAAFQWRSENGVFVGLTYRGSAELDIEDGEVTYHGVPSAAINAEPGVNLQTKFVDGGGAANLPLPANAALGIGYGGDGWSVEFDVVWTDWSDFDELILDFENESTIATGLPPPFPPALPLVEDQTIPENWDDTFSWRVGFGYSITAQHEFRAGLYFDENPIPDETMRASLPDADRWSAQVGYGFTTGGERFGLDAYYQFIRFDDRTIGTVAADESVVPGDYETDTSLLGASARFRF